MNVAGGRCPPRPLEPSHLPCVASLSGVQDLKSAGCKSTQLSDRLLVLHGAATLVSTVPAPLAAYDIGRAVASGRALRECSTRVSCVLCPVQYMHACQVKRSSASRAVGFIVFKILMDRRRSAYSELIETCLYSVSVGGAFQDPLVVQTQPAACF